MQYEEIGKKLEMHFDAKDIDLLQLGALNSSLHAIFNHVAVAIYEDANREAEGAHKPKVLDHIPQNFNRDDILIRVRVKAIREGSIIYDLQPVVAALFTEPGAIAIAQNLVASTLWAIGVYGTKIAGAIIKHKRFGPVRAADSTVPRTVARKRIRIEKLVKHLKESSNGGKITLRTEEEELTIEFYGESRESRDDR